MALTIHLIGIPFVLLVGLIMGGIGGFFLAYALAQSVQRGIRNSQKINRIIWRGTDNNSIEYLEFCL